MRKSERHRLCPNLGVCILQSMHLKGGYVIMLRKALSQYTGSRRTLQMPT